eukprot:1193605-Amphidinium_carterae.2
MHSSTSRLLSLQRPIGFKCSSIEESTAKQEPGAPPPEVKYPTRKKLSMSGRVMVQTVTMHVK